MSRLGSELMSSLAKTLPRPTQRGAQVQTTEVSEKKVSTRNLLGRFAPMGGCASVHEIHSKGKGGRQKSVYPYPFGLPAAP